MNINYLIYVLDVYISEFVIEDELFDFIDDILLLPPPDGFDQIKRGSNTEAYGSLNFN